MTFKVQTSAGETAIRKDLDLTSQISLQQSHIKKDNFEENCFVLRNLPAALSVVYVNYGKKIFKVK